MCIKLAVDKINEKPSDTLLSEIVKGMYMGELVKYDEWNGRGGGGRRRQEVSCG
jgi:hypothetical protein